MNHDRWEEMSSRYRDGDLDPRQRTQFEEHLEGCQACREAVEMNAVFAEGLKAAFDRAYPADFEARTLARINTGKGEADTTSPARPAAESWPAKTARWLRHGEFRIPVPVALAAAVCLIVFGAAVLRVAAPSIFGEGGRRVLVGSTAGEQEWIDVGAAEAEVRSMLKRTRTLLLALTTARPDEQGHYHLEAEEALSRDLIQEVRLLESSAYMDDNTDILSLIQDLEIILLDVSTWQGEADADRLALLRGGISDRSLIYRLATYEPRVGGD